MGTAAGSTIGILPWGPLPAAAISATKGPNRMSAKGIVEFLTWIATMAPDGYKGIGEYRTMADFML